MNFDFSKTVCPFCNSALQLEDSKHYDYDVFTCSCEKDLQLSEAAISFSFGEDIICLIIFDQKKISIMDLNANIKYHIPYQEIDFGNLKKLSNYIEKFHKLECFL